MLLAWVLGAAGPVHSQTTHALRAFAAPGPFTVTLSGRIESSTDTAGAHIVAFAGPLRTRMEVEITAGMDVVGGDDGAALTARPERIVVRRTTDTDGVVQTMQGDTERPGDSLGTVLRTAIGVPIRYTFDERTDALGTTPDVRSLGEGLVRSSLDLGLTDLLRLLPANPVAVGQTWPVRFDEVAGVPGEAVGTATLDRVEAGAAHVSATLSFTPEEPSGFSGTCTSRLVLQLGTSTLSQTTTCALSAGGAGAGTPMRESNATMFTLELARR